MSQYQEQWDYYKITINDKGEMFWKEIEATDNRIIPYQPIVDVLAKVSNRSKSEIRRLSKDNAIKITNEEGTEWEIFPSDKLETVSSYLMGRAIRVGKKQFFRFKEIK